MEDICPPTISVPIEKRSFSQSISLRHKGTIVFRPTNVWKLFRKKRGFENYDQYSDVPQF